VGYAAGARVVLGRTAVRPYMVITHNPHNPVHVIRYHDEGVQFYVGEIPGGTR
jgi:hypothetical protein